MSAVESVSPNPFGAYPESYYAASRNAAPDRPVLIGEERADVTIIGGGYSGLSAGIALAEVGYKVALIESDRIGFGASGRNGGQIVNGLNAGLQAIEKRHGEDIAAFFGGLLQEGNRLIRERVEKYNIACDLKDGNVFSAFTGKQMNELAETEALWRKHGVRDLELLDREGIRAHVGTDSYVGGLIDHSGGHMHPLNLALGEAAALEELGGRVFEQSRVTSVDYSSARPVAKTKQGRIESDHMVICGNAYLDRTVPSLVPRILPVSTQMMATAPLSEDQAQALLPTDKCVEDCRYILDYFRLSADRRLLFGGGTVYGGHDVSDVIAKLRPNMLTLFPALKDVAIDYAWNGNFALSFTRIPQMGRLAPHTYFAHGYSGHGVTGSHLFGKIVADAINGDIARFDVFANLPWVPFPGGRTFGATYSAIGSWYYGLRDRLGI